MRTRARVSWRDAETAKLVVAFVVLEMAKEAAAFTLQIEAAVGGPVLDGHRVDVLMSSAALFEEAVRTDQPIAAAEAIVRVMFLARQLAYSQGKVVKPTAADKA